MIFALHYIMSMAGYSAVGLLLGPYLKRYADASELDLGFVFMIQPAAALLRFVISARADRLQAHKRMLVGCLIGNAISYIPYLLIPYALEYSSTSGHQLHFLTPRFRFWVLVGSHIAACFFFCGVRSLGDALAVNYAKRVGSSFATYRKFGALSFGTFGFLLGKINENNNYTPDYVPSLIVLVSTLTTLSLLMYLWHDEYFMIVPEKQTDEQAPELPNFRQVMAGMGSKLTLGLVAKESGQVAKMEPAQAHHLTAMQQCKILLLLMRRDQRIPMYLLILFYGGMIGFAPQNFVFTFLEEICHTRGTCDGAYLAGFVMLLYCIAETTSYVIVNLTAQKSRVILLEISLLSYAIHYSFYGLVIERVSPYFFLFEMLHGLEYAISLSSCIELGFNFANEVQYIIPELIAEKVISKDVDQELVKVSLMATMNSCFTLIFEGAGTIVGVLICGLVIDGYGFSTAFTVSGVLATFGFFFVLVVVLVGKCTNWKPQIQTLIDQKRDLARH